MGFVDIRWSVMCADSLRGKLCSDNKAAAALCCSASFDGNNREALGRVTQRLEHVSGPPLPLRHRAFCINEGLIIAAKKRRQSCVQEINIQMAQRISW